MSSWPANPGLATLLKTNIDAGSDDPSLGRAQLEALLDHVNTLQSTISAMISAGTPIESDGSVPMVAVLNAAYGLKPGNVLRTDPNTLDWYEEGTFTPTYSQGGSSTGVTYYSQSGKFTRIGNLVFYIAGISLGSRGSGTGVVEIGGLPYRTDTYDNPSGVASISGTTGVASIMARASYTPNDKLYFSRMTTAGNQGTLTHADFSSSSPIISMSGFYLTS